MDNISSGSLMVCSLVLCPLLVPVRLGDTGVCRIRPPDQVSGDSDSVPHQLHHSITFGYSPAQETLPCGFIKFTILVDLSLDIITIHLVCMDHVLE